MVAAVTVFDVETNTACHPYSDGQTERTNQTIEKILRAYIQQQSPEDWDLWLTPVEFAINNATQASPGYSPFLLNNGRHPQLLLSALSQGEGEGASEVPAASDMVTRIDHLIRDASDNIKEAQESQARFADRHRRELELNGLCLVGDQVMLSTANLDILINKTQLPRKLTDPFIGPYKIKERISPVNYRLELPENFKIHDVFHASLLKPYTPNPEEFQGREEPPPPPIETPDGLHYEIERILKKRVKKYKVQYFVLWKGYPTEEESWVNKEDMAAPEAIKEFEKRAKFSKRGRLKRG
ncbi:uncharacterized protein VTP21DRAFT_2908 [Calcarisporiella thermophila]|uniref:uncharacterized protein n=1 Tax=Calcarisporiella thermophila TaxID=911321 RepID=UPI0037424675